MSKKSSIITHRIPETSKNGICTRGKNGKKKCFNKGKKLMKFELLQEIDLNSYRIREINLDLEYMRDF